MTRFKDFGATKIDAEPLSFKLHDEEFNCLPVVQGKVLLDLVAESNVDDPVKSAGIIDKFFAAVLTDESYARFEDLLHDKNRIVTVDTLADITGWLVEEYTNRPEGQPGVS